jgi:hypothetical protein
MTDELTRLRMENIALRDMLEGATDQIHGEWGSGSRESYDWLPEMEQHICGQTGHGPTRQTERNYEMGIGAYRREYHCVDTWCELCDGHISRVETETK